MRNCGEDRADEVMPPPRSRRCRVAEVQALPGYRVHVHFNDGTSGEVEMAKAVSSITRVSFDYKPAIGFARRAHRWYGRVLTLENEHGIGEPPLLVLLYSVMALEAFLDEQLDARLGTAGRKAFLVEHHKSKLTVRWSSAVRQLASPDPRSQEAVKDIQVACKDDHSFDLLVRARNKLIHPGRVTEVSNAAADRIEDDSIDRLIREVHKPPVSLPHISAQFPGMLTCRASARWSLDTLQFLVTGFFRIVSEPLQDDWAEVLCGGSQRADAVQHEPRGLKE